MNENLLEKYYNDLYSKEIADKQYNKQKYVSITMLKREKKWFKDYNDGNYEPILECKRKKKIFISSNTTT
jgi:hypothetical protein